MACMHMQNVSITRDCTLKTVYQSKRPSVTLTKVYAASVPSQESHAPDSGVARILGQHRLLIEHGFSYDQASLILQICDSRSSSQIAALNVRDLISSPVNAVEKTSQAPATADSSEQAEVSASTATGGAEDLNQQQQHTSLKSLEDRLSFVETELLKHSISIEATGQVLGIGSQFDVGDNGGSDDRLSSGLQGIAAYGDDTDLPQLHPQVLAVAEALLIRQGRVLPTSSSWQNPATADARLYRQQQQQQQQQLQWQKGVFGSSPPASNQAPSSIWSRRGSRTQLRAKPWRYQAIGSPGSSPDRQLLPEGYPPDADMMVSDTNITSEDGLVPYEPNGWAVAGTVMLVYVGVLLTFFAMIAGTGDTSNVDPDLMMLLLN